MVTARQGWSRADGTIRCGAATFVLLLTGCAAGGAGGEDDSKPAPVVSSAHTAASGAPASSATLTPSAPGVSDASAGAEVLEAYGSMWAERLKAYRAASVEGTDLERYMTSEALEVVKADLARMRKGNTAMRGEPGHEPQVSALATAAQPPTATVNDCVDETRWRTLDTTTGWQIPPRTDQPLRHGATARMERVGGGRWVVTAYTADRTSACRPGA